MATVSRQMIIEYLLKPIIPVEVIPQKKTASGDILIRDAHREATITVRGLGATSRVMIESAIVYVAALEALARHATPRIPCLGICLLLETVSSTSPDEIRGLLLGAKLPAIDILLVARRGRSWIHLPTFGLAGQWIDRADDAHVTAGPITRNAFTPANLWVLKSILYSGTKGGQSWWRQWKPDGWRSASELAKAGSLSVPTVTRCLHWLGQRGWVEWKRGEVISCPLRESVMTSWIEHARVMSAHRERIYVAPAFDVTRQAIAWIAAQRTNAATPWIITGWHAADHYGMRTVSSIDSKLVTMVTTGSLRAFCDHWKLVATDPRDALFVIEHDSDEHLQECGSQVDGIFWADPLQSAIDVVRDPLQGPAQADAVIAALSRDQAL